MKNCSFQSGEMKITYYDGIIEIVSDQSTAIYMSPDEFVNFFALCGKMANEIVRHSPLEMGWKPDEPTAGGG